MESIEQATEKALELMRSIKTLDDLKAHKDEIIDLIEQFIRLGIESLKSVIKLALSPEETKKKLDKFQQTQEYFNEKWESEMERISKIEGAKEFLDGLREEMESRMEPHAQELAKVMSDIMGSMMGQIMNGLGNAMKESFSEKGTKKEENEDSIENKDENDN